MICPHLLMEPIRIFSIFFTPSANVTCDLGGSVWFPTEFGFCVWECYTVLVMFLNHNYVHSYLFCVWAFTYAQFNIFTSTVQAILSF